MKIVTALILFVGIAAAGAVQLPTGGFSHVEPCGDYLLAFTPGLSNRFVMINRDGEVVMDSADAGLGYETYRSGALSPDGQRLALLVDDARVSYIAVLGPGDERREYKYAYSCTEPVWDGDGNLWYAVGGLLYKNDEETGYDLHSDHISLSPDGRYLVYAPYLWLPTDSRSPTSLEQFDAIYRLDLEAGARDLISDDREFIIPFYTTTGHIVSACQEGEVWLFGPDGEGEMISEGVQPSWCAETESVLFIKGTGKIISMDIPGAEIWLYELTGNLWQMTDTPDVVETWPVSWRGDVVAVDNDSGELIYIKQEW